MPDKSYKIIEVVGVSTESIQQAVRNAIKKASETLRNLDWFEVAEIPRRDRQEGGADFPGDGRRGPCQPALDAAVWRIRYPHRPGGRCAFRSLVTLPCFTRSLRSRSSLSGATMLFTVRTREDWS